MSNNVISIKSKEWSTRQCEEVLISEWLANDESSIVLDWNEYLVDDLTEQQLGSVIRAGLKSDVNSHHLVMSIIGTTLEEFVCKYSEEIQQTFNYNYGE